MMKLLMINRQIEASANNFFCQYIYFVFSKRKKTIVKQTHYTNNSTHALTYTVITKSDRKPVIDIFFLRKFNCNRIRVLFVSANGA